MMNAYAEMRAATRVRERPLLVVPRIPNELELQARWFAGDFGRSFVSTAGDQIEIVQFGTWNRESGPDFSDAAVSINGGETIKGCIEIDTLDRNWETHGHAINPAFESTVLHVFVEKSAREFFTRTIANRNVPQIQIDPARLPDAFSANIALAKAGRCQAPLKDLPEEDVVAVLDAAAKFRLQQKAIRLRRKIDNHGIDEALFQEMAGALGYKENKLPFTLLAQRLSLKFLRDHSSESEALLFGVAGFLEAPALGVYKESSREYVRSLWNAWWPHRHALQRLVLAPATWKIAGTRPSNHPQRRLAALSILTRQWPAFRRLLGKADARAIRRFFAGLEHPFWTTHYTLLAAPAAAVMAIAGESRVSEILANVLFPFWMSLDVDNWAEYARLPARLSNRRLETGATRLFGDDPRRKDFLKTVAHQQGLLQIYEDFCLQDDSDCAQCPFPEQMQQWR